LLHRVDAIISDIRYGEYLRRNADYEKNRRFCRHDWQHMLDVARIAYMLALESGRRQGLSKEIIYAAGLLHDIGRWREYRSGEDHAAAGARLAGPLLDRAGFSGAEKEIITAAIREHRNGGRQASSLGRLICTADDLSRPCHRCPARGECYKADRMATAGLLLY